MKIIHEGKSLTLKLTHLNIKQYINKESEKELPLTKEKFSRYLKILKVLSIRQRFVVKSDYFSLREDVLKDLYCELIL